MLKVLFLLLIIKTINSETLIDTQNFTESSCEGHLTASSTTLSGEINFSWQYTISSTGTL